MTDGHVLLLADGVFGEQVGEALRTLLSFTGRTTRLVREPFGDESASLLAGASLFVRASWRDVDTEFHEYAAVAERAGQPFLPVAFNDPQIRVGPLVVPGQPPCHSCYRTRARQHAPSDDPLAGEVAAALRRSPALGVTGCPPHLTMLAASLVLNLLGDSWGGRGPQRPGRVSLINVDSDQVRTWAVNTTAFCPTCSPPTERAALRKVRQDRLRALAAVAAGAPGGQS